MKKILILAAVVVVILVAGAIVYFNWRHNFLRKELPDLVFLKSDSVYQISYGDVYIDEVGGEVIIEKLLLKPDSIHRSDKSSLPGSLLEVYIPRLHLSGVQTDRAVLNEQLIARKLQLTEPIVTLYRNGKNDKGDETKKDDTDNSQRIYKAILRNLMRIKIDSILIDSARYHMVGWKSGDTTLTCAPVTVSLFDLDISDSTANDSSRVLFAKRAQLTVDKLKIFNDAGLYNFRFSSLDLDSEHKTLTAKKLEVDPIHSEAVFARLKGEQADRFDVKFSGAHFTNIDVTQVLNGNLVADALTVKEGIIKIFRDKNYPNKNISKIGRFPHQLLMRAGTDISLRKVDIQSGLIEYKEKSDLTGMAGKILFDKSTISIANLSNRPEDLRANPTCLINMKAKFLGVVPANVNLRLYTGSKNGRFAASGNLGATDATVLNQIVNPLGLANIESGQLNGCQFHIDGNDYGGNGTVKLLYNNLKVKLLKQDEDNGELKSKKLASLLANAAIKDENPKKNKPPRIAQVNYKRNPYKGFFNLVWKSIFAGIQETVGVQVKDEAVAKKDNQ
jgi:hypothetical protein